MSARVVVIPSDMSACGYYRMRLPAGAVQRATDWQVELYRPDTVQLGTAADGSLMSIKGLNDPANIDLVVMQRVATRAQVDLLRWFQQQGTAVVVDADDAMWCIDEKNPAHAVWNTGPLHWRWVDAAAQVADIVTTTTPLLAKRYGQRGHAEVLPNCVPGDLQDQLESVRDSLDQTPTVGWAGFSSSHPGDLTVVGDAVQRIQRETGCLVRAVGDGPGLAAAWGVDVDHVEPKPVGLAYYTALTTLDVGLVPLRDSQFNRGKSYLKALEYAACGVLPVVSDTPAHRALKRSLPWLCIALSPDSWLHGVADAVHHPDNMRAKVESNRSAVYQSHTYEVNVDRWVDAWQRALDRRARMRAL